MRVQPKTGCYFPITPTAFAAATRAWPLRDRDARVLRNPDRLDAGSHALVELRPGLDVTVFSLPVGVDAELGAKATLRALQEVGRWKNVPAVNPRDQRRAIVVYLEPGPTLRLIDHRAKASRRKFGAGEGLATSSKPKIGSRKTIDLGLLPLD